MRALTQALFALFCATLFCLPLAAQQEQPAAPGNPGTAASSSDAKGSIQGKVVQDPGGQPIRKVRIGLRGPMQYSAITDEAGQFKIENVQPGIYFAQLERPGFTEPRKTIRERQIRVSAGQAVNDLTFHMLAAGVISGRILDSDGDPLPHVNVLARSAAIKTAERFGPSGQASTNDLGEYRISDLPPGKYFVDASPPESLGPAPSSDNNATNEHLVYVSTYFPGSLDEAHAVPVEVTAGVTATATFGVQASRVFRVTGTVVGLPAGPTPEQLREQLEKSGVEGGGAVVAMTAASMARLTLIGKNGASHEQPLRGNGNFEFPRVQPGTYHAQIEVYSGFFSGRPSVKLQTFDTPIEVNGSDVIGIQLQIEPGGDVYGRFRIEGDEKIDWKQLVVRLGPVPTTADGSEASEPIFMMAGNGAAVSENGSFELKDVSPGSYQLVVSARGDKFRDYYTKSVLLAGRDVSDSGFPVSSSTILDVLISSKGASIDGTVLDADGKPASNATVITIPSSGKLGRPDAYQIGQTDEAGHFLLRGINPGDFTVLALDEMQSDYRSPEFARKYESKGEKVQLDESQKKTVTIKLITDETQ